MSDTSTGNGIAAAQRKAWHAPEIILSEAPGHTDKVSSATEATLPGNPSPQQFGPHS